MEIIDILSQPKSGQPVFTVDASPGVDAVDILMPVAGEPFQNAHKKKLFKQGDNPLILSAGIVLPYNFQFAPMPDTPLDPLLNTGCPVLYLSGLVPPSSVKILSQLGTNGFIHIPMENYEWALNAFIGNTATWGGDFELFGLLFSGTGQAVPQISMIGVPAILDNKVLQANIFLKVLHTKPMI